MDGTFTAKTITEKAICSVKWSALMEVVSRTASPIITVILARLLTPVDFGVVAMAMIAISFAQMFWDAGLGKSLVQTNESPQEAAHVVFWTNLILGLVIYVLLFVMAPWVAVFFKSPDSGPVLRVLGLQIVIASLSSVQQALFVRELDFRRLFWIKLSTAFVPGFFSIPLAFYGYGVWALVVGTLAGQTLNLMLLWHYSHWRPKLQYDLYLARKMFRFGGWVLVESLGLWLVFWGDSLIVGKFLGIHDLGIYRTGMLLVTIFFGLVLNSFLPVLYPVFSRFQNDQTLLKQSFHKVNRIVISLVLPMGVGVLLTGPELATALFGNKWQGLGFVLSILGFKEAVGWLVGINSETYRAMGRPDVNTKLLFAQLLYYMPSYIITAQLGLVTFVYARLGVALVAMPIHIYLCRKILKVSPFYLWHDGKHSILAALVMGICIAAAKHGLAAVTPGLPLLVILVVLMITGAGVYAATLWLSDRAFIVQSAILFRRTILA
jgi:PST family polysaccharide transporter